jgi:hypothetical protein
VSRLRAVEYVSSIVGVASQASIARGSTMLSSVAVERRLGLSDGSGAGRTTGSSCKASGSSSLDNDP